MANRIVTATVTGESIKLSEKTAGAAGSFNAVSLSFTFDSAWDGTTKKVYFFDTYGNNAVYILLTTDLLVDGKYIVPIPAEPLVYAGEMTITVKGIDFATDGTTAERIIMSASTTMKVLNATTPASDVSPVEPTPTQAEQLQTQIDSILADIEAAAQAAGSATAAAASALAAQTAETNAETAESNAELAESHAGTHETNASTYATNASNSALAASGSATTAVNAKNDAETAKTAAELAETHAKTSETNAKTSETNAGLSATAASGSATDANNAKLAAQTAQTNAELAETHAETAEVNAETAESNAQAHATNAGTSATNALNSATAAAGSATTAGNAKTAAETAQGLAETAQAAAELAETNAETAETNAGTHATNAGLSATAASGSATAANSAKLAAQTAQAAAELAETNAELAETNAETAETNAVAAKNAAELAQTAAESAQTLAETAKTGADTAKTGADSAKTAAQSAQTAAESARDAAVTAKDDAVIAKTAAQTAQGLAETAKTGAETAETNAETAEANAEASALDSEAYAIGTRNGVAVTSGDVAYQNNSKYYKDVAGEIVGGDYPTKTEAQGYVSTHDASGTAHATLFGNKVDKVAGKGLSTEDYTSAEKTKLSGIEASANNYVHPANHAISVITGLQTALDGKVDDSQVLTNVPAGAVFTDTITTINGKTGAIAKADIVALGIPAQDTTYSAATQSVAGLESAADKTKLDGIATGAEVNVNADWNASSGDAQILNKPTTMTPSSHTHGNLTNDGKIGSTADLPVFTTTAGAVTTKTAADARTALAVPTTGTTIIATSVSASTWSADTTYAGYGYRASITISGVTTDFVPSVTYGFTEATSGNYAPIATSYSGGVYLYSKVNTAITIASIVCQKAV